MARIDRISLRQLTMGLIGLLALIAILALALAAQYFRNAAFAAQRQSMTRVVAVASGEVLRQLDDQLFAFGTEMQARPEFRKALLSLQQGTGAAVLQVALQDPFTQGFSAMRNIDLIKLRVFDLQLEPLLQSKSSVNLPADLPAALLQKAKNREGADRLKAVSDLWATADGAYYSVLLPIGGFKLAGYLEVIADPGFNLRAVEKMTSMPLSLYANDGRLLYQSARDENSRAAEMLPLEHALRSSTGEPAMRIVCLSNITQLTDDLRHTTLLAVVSVFLMVGLATMLVFFILNRFVFEPVRGMQQEMARCAQGDLAVTIKRRMLHEFSVLADAFNAMAADLAAKIDQLDQLSRIDSLTSLANRHEFDKCLEREWRRSLRSHEPLSLLMLDIDHFKLYNDHYGHVGGDVCLRTVAGVLRGVVQRSSDLAARYGGEEFVVLLPNTSPISAGALGEKILAELQALNLPHAASPLERITVSIGVKSCCTAPSCSPSDLIEAADAALYQAKRAGRNRVVVADAMCAEGKCANCPGNVRLQT
jgi:diguanylate cyclase (GGDEF)-like protein